VSTGRFNAGKAVGEDEQIDEACDDREPDAAGLTRDDALGEVEDAANPEIPVTKLVGVADPLAAGLSYVHQGWAAGILAFGAVAAMTAVLLCFQLGQPRILMAMSRDGLLSPWFAKIHPKYRTPHVTTILTGVFVAFFSAFANIDIIVELTNIGTLFAFVLVCIGIVILRVREPNRPRKFRVPLVPVVPILGIAMCVFLMAGLPLATWIRFIVWLFAGLCIYFFYGSRRSRLAQYSSGQAGSVTAGAD
jgi:basic amino acid/polyamine antiporter, APA family